MEGENLSYIVSIFINVIMYPQYNNSMIKKLTYLKNNKIIDEYT
jgi:hypothetical protein